MIDEIEMMKRWEIIVIVYNMKNKKTLLRKFLFCLIMMFSRVYLLHI